MSPTASPSTAPTKDPCQATPTVCEKLRPLIAYLDSLTGRADLKVLEGLLRKLDISTEDIKGSCIFGERGYKRNTISKSEWYELLALCWHSGDRTPIHDHQGVSCSFKVLHGTGTEIRFRPTPSGLICPAGTVDMQPGYICSADDADIHEVANFQAPGQDLITLHIYSPPIKKMNVYSFTCPVPNECTDAYKSTPC